MAIVGAIGISGPSFRLDDAERLERLAGLVHEAAQRVSRQLG
jgi:DNA-binding IclR family transcriptional regulator